MLDEEGNTMGANGRVLMALPSCLDDRLPPQRSRLQADPPALEASAGVFKAAEPVRQSFSDSVMQARLNQSVGTVDTRKQNSRTLQVYP